MPIDVTLKPPPAFHLFRASVKHEVMHLVAVDRQAHERYRERLNVLRREIVLDKEDRREID